MVDKFVKVNDTTVASFREVRKVFGSTELAKRKESLEAALDEVNDMIAVLNA